MTQRGDEFPAVDRCGKAAYSEFYGGKEAVRVIKLVAALKDVRRMLLDGQGEEDVTLIIDAALRQAGAL